MKILLHLRLQDETLCKPILLLTLREQAQLLLD